MFSDFQISAWTHKQTNIEGERLMERIMITLTLDILTSEDIGYLVATVLVKDCQRPMF